MDVDLWKRIAVVAASLLLALAVAGGVLYFFSPSLFFEIIDPRGITARQALGSLVATVATAAFVKYIVQHETRAARDQADASASDALRTDATAIVRAYTAVQTFYKERSQAPTTLADRAARLIGRKQEVAKGIDRVTWRTLQSVAGSEGINAHLLFLSQMITPTKIEPISRYLWYRATFAFELTQANTVDDLEELYLVLFSELDDLEPIESGPLLETRLKGYALAAALAHFLQAIQSLGLAVDGLDAIKEQADLAYRRVETYFAADSADEEAETVAA